MNYLGQNIPPLVNGDGAATAVGLWILMAISAAAIGLFIYNQVLTAKVNQKALNAPPILQQQINPQPLIVAMEKEFVHRRDYDRDHTDLKNRLTENTTYVHERIHDFAKLVDTVTNDAHKRNELLAAVDERTKLQGRQLQLIDNKIDGLRHDLGIQKGRSGTPI